MNSPRLSAQTVSPQAKRHIGQILISQGILTEDQLRIALLEQLKTHQPVGKLLVNLGFVSEATLRDALSEKLGLQSVDLTQIVVDSMALKLVPRDFAKRHTIFPVALDREARKLIVALADTNNIVALDQVRAQLRGEFALETRLAGEGRNRPCDRPVLRPRFLNRRHPARDRDRRDRLPEPAGDRRRLLSAGGTPDFGAASPMPWSAVLRIFTSSRSRISCVSATV